MKDAPIAGRGFTLIETLVVVGLIAVLAALLAGGLRPSGTMPLQTAQAVLAHLVTAARAQANASGCAVRLLIHADPANPERFRRMIAMQRESPDTAGEWSTVGRVTLLPPETIVLPYRTRVPAGLYETPAAWTKVWAPSGGASELHSSSLAATPVRTAVQAAAVETWDVLVFTPKLTTGNSGDLVLATVRRRPPGSYPEGESPVRAESPQQVRGLAVSRYGVPALISGRGGF